MILETVRLLQEGQLEQAEYLLLEGLRYVEGALPDNAGVASLLDQLALVQFLLDRLPEAEASAQRMVELAAHMFAGDTAARAMCSLRLGAVLAGQGRWKEAVPLLEESQTALAAAFGEEYEALGEAEYYLTLAAVPRATEVGLADLETGLIAGLQLMRKNTGVGKLLASAALREHHRILDEAIKLEDWSKAESLFVQEMKLHEAVDPNGEGLSLLHYQFSTLQFILGQLEDAQKLAQRSYELTVQHSRADSDQAMLRRHRIGTIAAEQMDVAKAEQCLSQSQEHFSKRLGENNPITGEARVYLALSRLHELDTKLRGADPFDRVLGPGQRGDLLQELSRGLEAMAKGFGPEHMLVRKAEQLQRQRL
ncbi:hypothetical protein CVIRNUC_002471 [Coccomyxa viridis]|uniref:MalT-like TPR region domain-containing protein n=1 Tax=Coccomyxa viridis TaxID=1274662 RepID=A0AAV1I066_9CHLO|nr:hypothetical protein CVIRNUC_002471 [Coccomyxa viridis]